MKAIYFYEAGQNIFIKPYKNEITHHFFIQSRMINVIRIRTSFFRHIVYILFCRDRERKNRLWRRDSPTIVRRSSRPAETRKKYVHQWIDISAVLC